MPETSRLSSRTDWVTSGFLFAGLGLAAAGLNRVLDDVTWWFAIMAVAAVVLLAGAATRALVRRRVWGTVAAGVAAVMVVTLLFAPTTALLGVIPTPSTFGVLHEIELAGSASITAQDTPATADQGILYLLCLGVAAIAFVMDALAFLLRVPALTGIPLLVLLVVPSIVDPSLESGFFFVLVAAVYVAILLVRSRRTARPVAFGLAGAAIVAALVVPLALPDVDADAGGNDAAGAFSTGVNPIITLGSDLRQGEEKLALTYTTTEPGGVYMRLTALDDFTGASWRPTGVDVIPGNHVDAIGAAPGLTEAVPRTEAITDVKVANIASRWLPAPYAPTSVQGLVGEWRWEPDALGIRTEHSSARGQNYTVESTQISPSIDQLVAAGTIVEPGLERYLELPADLPGIVAQTAQEVAGSAPTSYEKAIALQDYFRGGDFRYSEDAPVESGYDGSGASVLAAFLEAKSGYCVHFSSAMASMARILGIPARIAVGFTPGVGTRVEGSDQIEYRITTNDLHAWPELYFSGVGWVRFEPTPGRGSPPEFAPLAVDDPATPDVDESVPTPVATTGATPPADRPEAGQIDASTDGGGDATSAGIPWWWSALVLFVALLLVPWAVRTVRRSRRLRWVRSGIAAPGWEELRLTADDLGLATSDTRTPRQLASDLSPHLDTRGRAALDRLRIALESEAFLDRYAGPQADDVRTVLRSLRRTAGVRRTLAATFLPRSLFAGLLPEVSRVG